MISSLQVAVVVIAIASLAVGKIESHYSRLNTYLIQRVDNDEIGPNIEAATAWLKEQENVKQPFLSKVPIEDLKKFTALQQVIEDTKCDHTAYEIMRANVNAVSLSRNAVRRIDKLILKIFTDHVMKCKSVYPTIYQTKKAQLDENVFARVKKLATNVMNLDVFSGRSSFDNERLSPHNLFHEYIKHRLSARKSFVRLGYALKDTITDNVTLDLLYSRRVPSKHTGRRVVDKDKTKDLVNKFVIEPCKQYEAEMGPDLFIPAEFDMVLHFELDNDNRDYYLGWSYFKICEALTSDESEVFDEVIKAVPKN